jgi:hypothetical protein
VSAAQLNVRPAAAGNANSAWVLAVHALGNARAWVLGIACGKEMGRDRPAEFASSGDDVAELRAAVAAFSREMHAALPALSRADLDCRLVPPAELWGEGEPKEITVREALLHVVEHASLHLGHIEITRDLATAKA